MSNSKKDNQEVFSKTSINWYPGHMAKTRKQIIEDLKLIDVVIELIDARIPISSRNPDINEIIKGKNRIIVLNKSDLADEMQTAKWVDFYKKQNIIAVVTDSNSGKGIQNVIKKVEEIMSKKQEEMSKKGRVGRTTRVMILGIPNVGKSSFINRIAGKSSLIVGNKPGVTKAKQWIRVNNQIDLLDTPGVLWPKFESQEVALNLAYTGTIKDDVIEKVEVAFQFIKYLLENYRDNILQRYNLEDDVIENILNQPNPENENIYEIMQLIGKKRGAIVSGGKVDDEKTANIILEDYRSGKLGKITIEKVK